jgi:hypothetical protein
MEAPSIAISPLGFALDLMGHKVLMRMHKRSTARSGGASTCLARAGGWTGGRGSTGVARSLRCGGREKAMEVEATATGGR